MGAFVQGEDSVKEKKGSDFSCNPMFFFKERKKKLIILGKENFDLSGKKAGLLSLVETEL